MKGTFRRSTGGAMLALAFAACAAYGQIVSVPVGLQGPGYIDLMEAATPASWTPSGSVSGSARFTWWPARSALLFGEHNAWMTNLGAHSFTGGLNSIATGSYSFAFGNNAAALGEGSFAVGINSEASGPSAVALSGIAAGHFATAIGGAWAGSSESVAIGVDAAAIGERSLALGKSSEASGYFATSIGGGIASGHSTVALGVASLSSGLLSVAVLGPMPLS